MNEMACVCPCRLLRLQSNVLRSSWGGDGASERRLPAVWLCCAPRPANSICPLGLIRPVLARNLWNRFLER